MDGTIRSVEAFPVSCRLPRPVGDGQGLQPVRQSLFVRMTSESGLVGWGEGGGPVPGADLVRRRLGPAIVGMDVRDSDLIHARLGRAGRGMLGAIDTAVWDLKGKLLGHAALPAARRGAPGAGPAYASLHNYSESADLADELRELVVDAAGRASAPSS